MGVRDDFSNLNGRAALSARIATSLVKMWYKEPIARFWLCLIAEAHLCVGIVGV